MRIGIDLGGTKIEGIALADDHRELVRCRIQTPAGDYRATIKAITNLVADIETKTGLTGTVGVGIPGTVSPDTGLVKNANSICLIGQSLNEDLATALARPVRLANDANCFAISEATDGAAAGYDVVFGIILGTGVGGGIVINGRALSGCNAIAGEWGHSPLPWPQDIERPGLQCYCGKFGCIETFLSGSGLKNSFRSNGGNNNATTNEIVARYLTGDTVARVTLDQYISRLARALATVINLLDPDIIVLGGGLSNIQPLYDGVPEKWSAWVFSDTVKTRLVQNRHGDSSGVRGAAWLWPAAQKN